jgi:hypothetical protein
MVRQLSLGCMILEDTGGEKIDAGIGEGGGGGGGGGSLLE